MLTPDLILKNILKLHQAINDNRDIWQSGVMAMVPNLTEDGMELDLYNDFELYHRNNFEKLPPETFNDDWRVITIRRLPEMELNLDKIKNKSLFIPNIKEKYENVEKFLKDVMSHRQFFTKPLTNNDCDIQGLKLRHNKNENLVEISAFYKIDNELFFNSLGLVSVLALENDGFDWEIMLSEIIETPADNGFKP